MKVSAPMCWAGEGYPAEDKFTGLFRELVEAYARTKQSDAPFEFGVYMGLLRAYSLVTGDPELDVGDQVADAARETVLSS